MERSEIRGIATSQLDCSRVIKSAIFQKVNQLKEGQLMKSLLSKILRRLLILLTAIVCYQTAPAFHGVSGFYLGAGLGAGWSSASQKSFTELREPPSIFGVGTAQLIHASNAVFKAMVGYQLYCIALEMGYIRPPSFTEHDAGIIQGNIVPPVTLLGGFESNEKSSLNLLNLTAKLLYPTRLIDLFFGGGLGIVYKNAHSRVSIAKFGIINPETIVVQAPRVKTTFYRPQVVAGFNVHLAHHLMLITEYMRVFGRRNISVVDAAKNFLPDIHTITFSLAYFFR
ncbi:hypothetical protein [Coxiella burnetii]|uniref:hypothetical protein n=1 Tax=Coxiella burnetii TaxID=777 RepID=UPI002175E477|nr:hypothetical protein [Coxiella burnetii]